jgi:hypothetical protein
MESRMKNAVTRLAAALSACAATPNGPSGARDFSGISILDHAGQPVNPHQRSVGLLLIGIALAALGATVVVIYL